MDDRFDILAIETFSWTPHLEIAGEILLREAAAGRKAGFAFLDVDNIDELPRRTALVSPALAVRRRTRLAKVRNLERIISSCGVDVIRHDDGADSPQLSCRQLGIRSIGSLRDFRYEGAALGFGILASLIRYSGDYDPQFSEHRVVIDRLLTSAVRTFNLSRGLINRYRPAEILVFNGRMATSKAVAEAARLSGSRLIFHEIGGTYERFLVSPVPPQGTAYGREYLRKKWDSAGAGRAALAAGYFSPGRNGAPTPELRHIGEQVRGLSIPSTHRRRIVYYASSIDEYATVEAAVEYPVFESQRSAVQWLVSWVQQRLDTELIIRIHPRMRWLSNRERQWWDALAGGNVTVLQADSPVDSYALASTADRVLCFHSSLGPEATYLGRVAILIGDADYRGLDCVYEPRTVAELERMLTDEDLRPKARENCLPFGYGRLMWGQPFLYYQPKSYGRGSFFGKLVAPFPESLPTRSATRVLFALDRMFRALNALKPGQARK